LAEHHPRVEGEGDPTNRRGAEGTVVRFFTRLTELGFLCIDSRDDIYLDEDLSIVFKFAIVSHGHLINVET